MPPIELIEKDKILAGRQAVDAYRRVTWKLFGDRKPFRD